MRTNETIKMLHVSESWGKDFIKSFEEWLKGQKSERYNRGCTEDLIILGKKKVKISTPTKAVQPSKSQRPDNNCLKPLQRLFNQANTKG